MKFYINTENGSGQKFTSKEEFIKEISLMIDDCVANGGTVFEISVDADASCFYDDEGDEGPCRILTEEEKKHCAKFLIKKK